MAIEDEKGGGQERGDRGVGAAEILAATSLSLAWM